MINRFVLILFFIFCSICAFSKDDTNVEVVQATELTTSHYSPAATIIGASPERVLRPNSFQAVSGAVIDQLQTKAVIPQDFDLEIIPSMLIVGDNISIKESINNGIWDNLWKYSSLSIARKSFTNDKNITGDTIGLGVTFNITRGDINERFKKLSENDNLNYNYKAIVPLHEKLIDKICEPNSILNYTDWNYAIELAEIIYINPIRYKSFVRINNQEQKKSQEGSIDIAIKNNMIIEKYIKGAKNDLNSFLLDTDNKSKTAELEITDDMSNVKNFIMLTLGENIRNKDITNKMQVNEYEENRKYYAKQMYLESKEYSVYRKALDELGKCTTRRKNITLNLSGGYKPSDFASGGDVKLSSKRWGIWGTGGYNNNYFNIILMCRYINQNNAGDDSIVYYNEYWEGGGKILFEKEKLPFSASVEFINIGRTVIDSINKIDNIYVINTNVNVRIEEKKVWIGFNYGYKRNGERKTPVSSIVLSYGLGGKIAETD